jgi:hypothetical protein
MMNCMMLVSHDIFCVGVMYSGEYDACEAYCCSIITTVILVYKTGHSQLLF